MQLYNSLSGEKCYKFPSFNNNLDAIIYLVFLQNNNMDFDFSLQMKVQTSPWKNCKEGSVSEGADDFFCNFRGKQYACICVASAILVKMSRFFLQVLYNFFMFYDALSLESFASSYI